MSTDTIPTEGGDTAALAAALAKAIARAHVVEKDSTNSYHKYKYASAEGLLAEAREALAAEGLSVVPKSHRLKRLDVDAMTGYFADLETVYKVRHSGGGWELCTSETPVLREKGRPEDKAVATAKTYSIGYFLRDLLLLARVDEETDADQRDDRDYQPRQGQGNGLRPQGNGQSNGNGQRPPDNRDQGARGGAKLPDPPAKPAETKPPTSGAPAFSMTAALLAIARAADLAALEALVPSLATCPEPQKVALREVYNARHDELGGSAAPAAGAPASGATPIDKGWSEFTAAMSTILKADTAAWTNDDFGADFAALIEKAESRKDLERLTKPWLDETRKNPKSPRVRALSEQLKRLYNDRDGQLVAAQGAR